MRFAMLLDIITLLDFNSLFSPGSRMLKGWHIRLRTMSLYA